MSCTFLAGIDTLRFTRLDNCGRPICAADSSFVTSCVASLNLTSNVEDGAEISYTNGRGERCGYLRRCPTLSDLSVEMEILFASPELLDITTASPVRFDYAGQPIGWETGNVSCTPFAVEGWINVLNQECADNVPGQWLYVLLPWVSGAILGDLEIGAEAVNFTINGNTRAGGNWGTGPYTDVQAADAANTPGRLLAPLEATSHRLIQETTIQPPTPSCEYVPVTGCLSS